MKKVVYGVMLVAIVTALLCSCQQGSSDPTTYSMTVSIPYEPRLSGTKKFFVEAQKYAGVGVYNKTQVVQSGTVTYDSTNGASFTAKNLDKDTSYLFYCTGRNEADTASTTDSLPTSSATPTNQTMTISASFTALPLDVVSASDTLSVPSWLSGKTITKSGKGSFVVGSDDVTVNLTTDAFFLAGENRYFEETTTGQTLKGRILDNERRLVQVTSNDTVFEVQGLASKNGAFTISTLKFTKNGSGCDVFRKVETYPAVDANKHINSTDESSDVSGWTITTTP